MALWRVATVEEHQDPSPANGEEPARSKYVSNGADEDLDARIEDMVHKAIDSAKEQEHFEEKALLVQLEIGEFKALVRDAVRQELQSQTSFSAAREATSSAEHAEGELEPMLTTAQFAELLNCGERTLYRWVQEGKVPSPHRIGGSTLRWYGPDVRRWLEEERRRA